MPMLGSSTLHNAALLALAQWRQQLVTALQASPETVRVAWDRATGKVWMKAIIEAGWAGGGDPTAGTLPTFTLTGSEVYYPMSAIRGATGSATLVYSGFAGGLPADYVSIADAVTDPDESPFPTPTPTPGGGGGLPISEELAAYLGLPPKPHPPMVRSDRHRRAARRKRFTIT